MASTEVETSIEEHGPLGEWTEENPVPWSEWYANNNISVEVTP
jgi:hypothetical protein